MLANYSTGAFVGQDVKAHSFTTLWNSCDIFIQLILVDYGIKI